MGGDKGVISRLSLEVMNNDMLQHEATATRDHKSGDSISQRPEVGSNHKYFSIELLVAQLSNRDR